MTDISATFPPKFSQKILYPAIYNLDEYDIPNGYDLTSADNLYFAVHFDGYGINETPVLTYGKHKFNVYVTQPQSSDTILRGMDGAEYNIPGGIPKLKTGTRILFEIKDPAGVVVFSDVIPNYGTQGFSGYVWVKQDPLRTFEDIQEGYGKFRLVAQTTTTDNNWRNRYNVRFTGDVNFNLVDSQNIPYQNPSPIIFQNTTASMGSGSGLDINESITEGDDVDENISNVQISCSKMMTYGGKVQTITTFIKVSGSSDGAFNPLADHTLTSSLYENEITKDYSQGINTLSERFKINIPTTILQQNGSSGNNVKFQLKFKNPYGAIAKDINNVLDDFILEFPPEPNTWINFNGATATMGSSFNQKIWDDSVISTSEGQFSFAPDSISAPSGSGGQKYKTGTGKKGLLSYGTTGGSGGPPRGGGGGGTQ